MKRKHSKFGFTLIELMVALGLFAALSITVYTVLKNSLDSTLKANTQQTANENAKSIMSIITADLKSSMVLNSRLLASGTYPRSFYQYPSSVIFPPTTSFSSAYSGADLTTVPGILSEGNTKWGTILPNNQNKIFFYNQKNSHDGTGNLETSVIEYRVAVDNDYSNCRLERREYNWSADGLYSSTWLGLKSDSASSNLSIDGANITFNSAGLPAPQPPEVITKLPNMGDAILLYTERGIDDSFTIVGDSFSNAKLAGNQYNLKVAVFQTVRPYGKVNPLSSYLTCDGNNYLRFQKAFFDIFSGSIDSYLQKGGDKKKAAIRQNYKYAEINSVVTIRTSNLK